jgi:hypothetical protein
VTTRLFVDRLKPLEFSPHAREKMLDRGASEREVETAIRTGSSEPARTGRVMFRKNFMFDRQWRWRHYTVKQVAPIVAEESDRLVVVTVFVHYF